MADVSEPLIADPEAPPLQLPTAAEAEHWTRRWARKIYNQISSLSTSVFFGLITAFCLKSIGQSVAIAIIFLFIGVQVLSYYGFINMSAVRGAMSVRLDLNSDGRVDIKDVSMCCGKVMKWSLSWGVPAVLAFTFGFWVGWRVL